MEGVLWEVGLLREDKVGIEVSELVVMLKNGSYIGGGEGQRVWGSGGSVEKRDEGEDWK